MTSKNKKQSNMILAEEHVSDSDTGIPVQSISSSPNRNTIRSPKKKSFVGVPKESLQSQLDVLTDHMVSLAENVSLLLSQKAAPVNLIKEISGKLKPSHSFLTNSHLHEKRFHSDASSNEDSDELTEYARNTGYKNPSHLSVDDSKIQLIIKRSKATFTLSFMKGAFLPFLGLMDDFYTCGLLLFLPDGKVYTYGPLKKEDNRLSLVFDGTNDPSLVPPQQRLVCAFPTNLPDFVSFGSLIKNMISYGQLSTNPLMLSDSVRANTASEVAEAFNFYHEKFLFTENQDKFNHLTNFAVCMHYFVISWNFANLNNNLQLIWSQESKDLWTSMKGHYVKEAPYFVPEYPINDILHLLGSFCPSCLRRGNCTLFCESCFAKKPAKDKANGSISQWSDLNLVQHKILLNGSRKGLNRSMGLSTF